MEATKKKKSYELNCIFALSDGQKIANICDKISDWVNKNGGEVISLEKTDEEGKASKGSFWVEKKYFAYSIKKNKAGFYLSVFFDADPSDVKDLSRMLKLEASVVRFMVTDVGGAGRKLSSGAKELSQVKEAASVDAERAATPIETAPVEAPKAEVIEDIEKVEAEVEKEEEEVVLVEEKVEEGPKEAETAVEEVIEERVEPEEEVLEETPAEIEEPVEQEKIEESEEEKAVQVEEVKPKKEKEEKDESKKKDAKKNKISLDDLDKRLDDILNEEIL